MRVYFYLFFFYVLYVRQAVFINVGRGDVIDEESLMRALDLGFISGAMLDVFQTEPLPPTSTLWRYVLCTAPYYRIVY